EPDQPVPRVRRQGLPERPPHHGNGPGCEVGVPGDPDPRQEATSLPFTACRKAAHSVPPNTRCPVPGFLESRTADRPGRAATSTQSPWEPLWVDFFQHSPSSGKRGFNAWFLSLPVFLEDALQQRPSSAAFFGGSRLDLLENRRVLRHFILVRGELTGVLSFDVNRGEVFRLDSKYDERGRSEEHTSELQSRE